MNAKQNRDQSAYPIPSMALSHGLTKREAIAAMVPPTEISVSWGELMVGPHPGKDEAGNIIAFTEEVVRWWFQVEARYAVMRADALLAGLEHVPEEPEDEAVEQLRVPGGEA